jgi:hypothetical protein
MSTRQTVGDGNFEEPPRRVNFAQGTDNLMLLLARACPSSRKVANFNKSEWPQSEFHMVAEMLASSWIRRDQRLVQRWREARELSISTPG